MKVFIKDGQDHVGDELPQQVVGVYDCADEKAELHIHMTHEGLIFDFVVDGEVDDTRGLTAEELTHLFGFKVI